METRLIFEWGLVLLFLAAMVYTMIVIKEERQSYLENAKTIIFHQLKLMVPSWWTQTFTSEQCICFERTDTRYDWKACLTMDSMREALSIEESLLEWLKAKEVLFDEINSVIHNPESFSKHPQVLSSEWEIVRLEGTATQKQVERIYLDTFLVRDHINKRDYFCESRSSVLNGMVEGPYFEDMMNHVQKAD